MTWRHSPGDKKKKAARLSRTLIKFFLSEHENEAGQESKAWREDRAGIGRGRERGKKDKGERAREGEKSTQGAWV